jgi:RHS repeat-associated protein
MDRGAGVREAIASGEGGEVKGELSCSIGTTRNIPDHIYLSDMPLATVRPTDTVYYYHTDHINTPRVMTNSAGTVAWQAAYHGFGHAEVDGASTITNNIRFPGQYFDAETNLHYNWNRYYDPRTGRYLTPDPIGLEGGIDPYVYAENRPVNLVDSEGLDALYINYDNYLVNIGGGFKLPLGHGAVVSIDPKTGHTEYYEFGRYDNDKCGRVVQRSIPNLTMVEKNVSTEESIKNLLDYLSINYGKGNKISFIYYRDTKPEDVRRFVRDFKNNHSCYNLFFNNCKTFGRKAASISSEVQR